MRTQNGILPSLVVACGLIACATAPTSQTTAAKPAEHELAVPAPRRSLPVLVTGVLQHRGATVEICPAQAYGPCAGIELAGHTPDDWVSTPEQVRVWKVSGHYDGRTLRPIGAEISELGSVPNYRNRCPEFQEPLAGQNPDDSLSTNVATLLAEQKERVAGQWWDMERQTMVIPVKGDASALATQVKARFAKSRICLQGGARYSERELELAREQADRILSTSGVVWSSSSLDVVRNLVVYDAEVLDEPTRTGLKREVGDAVRVLAFIELPGHSLAELPPSPKRGDIELVTANSRSGASMAALGRFTVYYDKSLACVYLEDSTGQRLLPVWPFGYWASANPFVVYDYDDKPVAQPGRVVEFGGGQVDIQHVKATNTCGAKNAFIGSPQSSG